MDAVFVPKILDVLAGIILLLVTLLKWRQPKGNISMKELMDKIEEKDREIERLTIQHHAWKMRHDNLANECKNKKHLRLS